MASSYTSQIIGQMANLVREVSSAAVLRPAREGTVSRIVHILNLGNYTRRKNDGLPLRFYRREILYGPGALPWSDDRCHAGYCLPVGCQLRVAPYSYDWIDNKGRKSPRVLTPGLEELNTGQWFMAGFTRVVDFTPNRQVTIQNDPSWRTYGDFKVSYLIVDQDAARCRLLVKMVVKYAHGLTGWLMRSFLPCGDLVMMRKQLLTLKALSERTYRDHGR